MVPPYHGFRVDLKAIAVLAAVAGRARFEEADLGVNDRLGRVDGDDLGLDGDLVAGLQLSAELVELGLPPSMAFADRQRDCGFLL